MPAQKIIGDYHLDTLQHQQTSPPVVVIPPHSTDAAFQAGAGTHQRKRSTAGSPFQGSGSSGDSSPLVHVNGQQLPVDGRNRAHPGTKRTHSGRELTGQVGFDEKVEIQMQSKEDIANGGGLGRRSSLQQSKGLNWKKIGVLAGLGFVLITVTRWLMPHDGKGYDSTNLTPRDYLNASINDPAPFAFCPVFGPGDPVAERRGQWGLLKSRLHQGSNARVQKVIQKALSGLPVTISVLGSSVSACHGAGDDPVATKCYPSKFFDWWNSIFPHPASELTNGASRNTDSAYYAYCSAHHLPDQTDLVILEFDAADPNDPDWLTHFELLVRSILVRPEMPAVIILGHFSPQLQAQNGFAGPELLHTVVAQFYDVPHIRQVD
ncbi:hypothetical protein QFC21_002619 [Naganishia friedmannii]|uniref:Uncharacterized protein n=1 Tax=Naganishia friedmannii TaxID=89922 RepID=A0ACC2VX62_9TREE|nr:hypothetical protein QFC21_002619 [Naganishia friedmannii]